VLMSVFYVSLYWVLVCWRRAGTSTQSSTVTECHQHMKTSTHSWCCWYFVLVCWCVDALVCWWLCWWLLMCWCVDDCVGVLMCWCVNDVDVLWLCWSVGVLWLYWCVRVLWLCWCLSVVIVLTCVVTVLICWSVVTVLMVDLSEGCDCVGLLRVLRLCWSVGVLWRCWWIDDWIVPVKKLYCHHFLLSYFLLARLCLFLSSSVPILARGCSDSLSFPLELVNRSVSSFQFFSRTRISYSVPF
jgi:hypothetical protein